MVSLFGRGFESHQLHKEVIIYYTDSYLFFYVLSFLFHFCTSYAFTGRQ